MAAVAQTNQAKIDMVAQPGRALVAVRPEAHVTLASARATHITLASSSPISLKRDDMDGIPTITVSQFQRVTLLAYVVTVAGTAITQATTQSVQCAAYRPSQEGGTPILEFVKTPSAAVFDTVQTDAKDPDGYNVSVEFEMSLPYTASGGSTYTLEAVVELKTGEMIPLVGRVHCSPVLSQPPNVY